MSGSSLEASALAVLPAPPEGMVASHLEEQPGSVELQCCLQGVASDVHSIKASLQKHGETCEGLAKEVSELHATIRVGASATGPEVAHTSSPKMPTPGVAAATAAPAAGDSRTPPDAACLEDEAVHSSVPMETAVEALWAGLEKSRAQIVARVEEMYGFLRAADKDHCTQIKALQEWQGVADKRLADVGRELRFAGEATRSLERVKSMNSELEHRMNVHGKRLEEHRSELNDRVASDIKILDERYTKNSLELHRLLQGVEQRAQAASKQEADDILERCVRHADSNKAATEQRLELDAAGLREALKTERETTVRDSRDLEARVFQHSDEFCRKLDHQLQESNAASERRYGVLTAALEEAARRLDEAQARTEEVARHAELRLQEVVQEACDALAARLQAKMDEVTQRNEEWHDACTERIEQSKQNAADGCAQVREQGKQCLDALRSESSEWVRQLRVDLDHGTQSLNASLASTHELLQSELEREMIAARREIGDQAARQSAELDAVRSSSSAALSTQASHLAEMELRVDRGFQRSSADLEVGLKAHAEQMQGARDELEAELRWVITEASRRTLSRIDDEANRVLALATSVAALESETERSREELQSAVSGVRKLAGSAKEDSARAQAQARSAEEVAAAASTSVAEIRAGVAEASAKDASTWPEELTEVRMATGSLAAALVKVAQCCGFLDGLEEDRNEISSDDATTVHLPAERIGLRQVVDWERSGAPLALRVERSWQARFGARAQSLLSVLKQKADVAAVAMVQHAVRQLDVRLRDQESGWVPPPTKCVSDPSTTSVVGEPFVGSYGTQAPIRRRRGAGETHESAGITTGDGSAWLSPTQPDAGIDEAASTPPPRTPEKETLLSAGISTDDGSAALAGTEPEDGTNEAASTPCPRAPARRMTNDGGPLKARPLTSRPTSAPGDRAARLNAASPRAQGNFSLARRPSGESG